MRLNARVCVHVASECLCVPAIYGCNFERRESSIFQRIMCVGGDGILSLLAPLMRARELHHAAAFC